MKVPVKPQSDGTHHVDHHIALHERVLEGKGLIIGKNIRVSTNENGQYILDATPGGAGSVSGLHWQSPRELDPTVAVAQDTLVYVSPNNPICTIGLTDLTTSVNTKATAGIWLALQDVPAKVGSDYNVPQDPIPSNGGAVSGSPLSGDADSVLAFWILIKPVC